MKLNRPKSSMAALLALLGSLLFVGAVSPATSASAVTPLLCDGLAPGSYVPGPDNTGAPATPTLTRVNPVGELLTITTPGTVIENQDIWGWVRANAANVTIRNSVVRGGSTAPTSTRPLIQAWDTGVSNLKIEGVSLKPQKPSAYTNGVNGHNYTAKCVKVFEVVDGFNAYNSGATTTTAQAQTNVTVTQSYCYDLSGWSPAPHSDNKSHTDCFAGQGAKNVTLSFNRFDAILSKTIGTLATTGYAGATGIPADPNYITNHPQALSAVMVNAVTLAGVLVKPEGWNVYGNWFSGGDVPINAGADNIAGPNLGRICGNDFAGDAHVSGATVWVDAAVTLNTCDGTAEANSVHTPVTVRRNA